MNVYQLQHGHELYSFNANLESLPISRLNNLKLSLLRLRSFYLLILNNGVDSLDSLSLDAVRNWETSVGLPSVGLYDKPSINAQLELLDEVHTLVDSYSNIAGTGSISYFSSRQGSSNYTRNHTNTATPQPQPQPQSQPQQQPQQQPQPQPQQQQQQQHQRNDSYVVINISTLTPLILPLLFLILKCSLMLYIFCRHGTWPRKLIMAALTIGYSIWEATRFINVRRNTIHPPNNQPNNNPPNNPNQPNNGNNYDALNQAAQQALNNLTPHQPTLNPFDRIMDFIAHLNLHYEAQRLRIPGPVPSSNALPPFPQSRLPQTQRPPRQPMWWTKAVVPFLICVLTLIPEVERRRSRALKWRYSAFKTIKHNERARKEREREGRSGEQSDGLLRPPAQHAATPAPTAPPSSDAPEIEEERVAEEAQVENWEE